MNGRLSAEAIQRAIAITKPGRFEYELEAEATYHLFKNGVQGNGYPAIVGTGTERQRLALRRTTADRWKPAISS